MRERWLEGFWLGKTFTSDEHLVMNMEGRVFRSRAAREMPKKFTLEMFHNLTCTPHDPTGVI